MVRGSAALLALAAGVALFLVAGELPGASTSVTACAGAGAVVACVLALLPGRDEPIAMGVFAAGAVLLAVALNRAEVGVEVTPVEALFGAAAGLLFAFGFAVPAAVVALPVLVAGIDGASLLDGAGEPLVAPGARSDVLSLDLPDWGREGVVARLGVLDATFLALFAAWSLRYALRPRIAVPLMALGLVGAVAGSVALERALPTLPALALGFLLPALDRLPALLRSDAPEG